MMDFRRHSKSGCCRKICSLLIAGSLFITGRIPEAAAQSGSGKKPAVQQTDAKPEKQPSTEKKPTPLTPNKSVLLDFANKRLLLKTKVVLREGLLEMLICRKGSKEHESILAVDSAAYVIHTGLLALGAKPGTPVRFEKGKIIPPTGTEIQIYCTWTDKQDKIHRVKAQSLVRHAINRFYTVPMEQRPTGLVTPDESELRYDPKLKELIWYGPMTAKQRDALLKLSPDKPYQAAIKKFFQQSQSRPMKAKWVFAGSGFYTETMGPDKGKKFYQAEGGDYVCVANFPTAMLDIDEESSADGSENLLYEAWTEKLPPEDTPVLVELIPVLPEQKNKANSTPKK